MNWWMPFYIIGAEPVFSVDIKQGCYISLAVLRVIEKKGNHHFDSNHSKWADTKKDIADNHEFKRNRLKEKYNRWITMHPLFLPGEDIAEDSLYHYYTELLYTLIKYKREDILQSPLCPPELKTRGLLIREIREKEVLIKTIPMPAELAPIQQEINAYEQALTNIPWDLAQLRELYDVLYKETYTYLRDKFLMETEQEYEITKNYLSCFTIVVEQYQKLQAKHPEVRAAEEVFQSLKGQDKFCDLLRRKAVLHFHPDKAFNPEEGTEVMLALQEITEKLKAEPKPLYIRELTAEKAADKARIELLIAQDEVARLNRTLQSLKRSMEFKREFGSHQHADELIAEQNKAIQKEKEKLYFIMLAGCNNLAQAKSKGAKSENAYKAALLYLLEILEKGSEEKRQ